MKDKQLYLFGFNKSGQEGSGRKKVIMPLDGIILFSIIGVFFFTVAFSLGVERGKRIKLAEQIISEKEETTVKEAPVLEKTLAEEVLPAAESKESAQDDGDEVFFYYIQVASFHKETTAYAEAKVLKEKGYPVSVTKKGEYAVVSVGNFENRTEAESNQAQLRKKYKDCMLKKL